MNNRFFSALSAATVVAVLAPLPAAGQASWTLPRTTDGQPDLQGVWANNSATPFERPEQLADKAQLTDEEVAELALRARELFNGETDAAFGGAVFEAAFAAAENYQSRDGASSETPKGTGNYNQFWLVDREFNNRTSLVVDPPNGRIPALTAAAEERKTVRRDRRRDHPADSYTDRSTSDRCITYGVPRTSAGYNSYFQIIQSADHVVILQEMIHDARVIPLDGRPHLNEKVRQLLGDSRAHWDGDTLVVETTNYSSKSNFQNAAENLHLVERFTRVGPDTVNWEVSVNDPTTWTSPWSASIPLAKSEDAIYEFACHEGNYAMEGILTGHRMEEKVATTDSQQ
jgi:hypothetical protein